MYDNKVASEQFHDSCTSSIDIQSDMHIKSISNGGAIWGAKSPTARIAPRLALPDSNRRAKAGAQESPRPWRATFGPSIFREGGEGLYLAGG